MIKQLLTISSFVVLFSLALSAQALKPYQADDRYLIKEGDSLGRIAQEIRPDPAIVLSAIVQHIHANNLSAFRQGNINYIVVGARLDLPTEAEFNAMPRRSLESINAEQPELKNNTAAVTPLESLAPPEPFQANDPIIDSVLPSSEVIDVVTIDNNQSAAEILPISDMANPELDSKSVSASEPSTAEPIAAEAVKRVILLPKPETSFAWLWILLSAIVCAGAGYAGYRFVWLVRKNQTETTQGSDAAVAKVSPSDDIESNLAAAETTNTELVKTERVLELEHKLELMKKKRVQELQKKLADIQLKKAKRRAQVSPQKTETAKSTDVATATHLNQPQENKQANPSAESTNVVAIPSAKSGLKPQSILKRNQSASSRGATISREPIVHNSVVLNEVQPRADLSVNQQGRRNPFALDTESQRIIDEFYQRTDTD